VTKPELEASCSAQSWMADSSRWLSALPTALAPATLKTSPRHLINTPVTPLASRAAEFVTFSILGIFPDLPVNFDRVWTESVNKQTES
jgi:hypothetical protein